MTDGLTTTGWLEQIDRWATSSVAQIETPPGCTALVPAKVLTRIALVTRRAAVLVRELSQRVQTLEHQMGRASQAIDKLKGLNAALQVQLSAAKANSYDATDTADIASVLDDDGGTDPTPANGSATNGSGGSAANGSSGSTANGSSGSTASASPATFLTTGAFVTDAAGRTVYAYSGPATTVPDPTQWPPAGTYNGQQVYYFAGDTTLGMTAGGGVAGVWATIPSPPKAG